MSDAVQAKIAELEAEMARTQKNKATNVSRQTPVSLSSLLTVNHLSVSSLFQSHQRQPTISPLCALLGSRSASAAVAPASSFRIYYFLPTTTPQQYHLGTLKAKIAKLKSELVNGPGGKSAGSKDAGRGFDVTKSGDTRIGLVGFPSVGKSTLLTTLTGTRSEAAAYAITE